MKKPRLLLDENVGIQVAKFLKRDGYDVASILEESPGIADEVVLDRALAENRVVVTLDKDFGTLIFLHSQKHAGVILLRLEDETPKNIFRILNKVLTEYISKLTGKFITVSETKIRLR